MSIKLAYSAISKTGPSPQVTVSHICVLVFILFIALALRLYKITEPPLDFSPIRQYQNAHIMRGLYYESNDEIPEWRKTVAKINMERMGFVLEPRILEKAAVAGYKIIGSEQLWIPRTLSSIFWIIGGFFLYLTGRIFYSHSIALAILLFYLFLPYAVLSSRSIQPDPLMVAMMLVSIYMINKFDEAPSLGNLVAAALISSGAVLVKPYCIFMILGIYFALAVERKGATSTLKDWNTFVFGFLIILPAVFHYALPLILGTGFYGEHAKGSFLPHLLLNDYFWTGWLSMIGSVVGYMAFTVAIVGLFKTEPGKLRALLLGLWTGYLLYGVSATYQIHTHIYYHMPFIPIIGLSLGPVFSIVTTMRSRFKFVAVLVLILIFLLIGTATIIHKTSVKSEISKYKGTLRTIAAFTGLYPEILKFLKGDFQEEVRIAREIGEHVRHSTNTLFLTPDFGRVIAYHGEFAGLPWPTSRSLYGRKVRGERVPDIQKDFTPHGINILFQGQFIQYTPDFFIVTAFEELEGQAPLKEYPFSNFPVLVQTEHYLIFDMRKMEQ